MNSRRWLITLTLCVLVFAALAVFKVMQIRAAIAFGESFPEPSQTVEAALVERTTVQSRVTTIATVVAPQTVDLRNELEGRIAKINFISGSKVQAGEILLQLDITEESARLKAAQARARLSELDLKRVRKLRKNKTVSEERLDQAEAQFNIARADMAELKATIDKKTLRAPFDAHTGLHQLEVGEFLSANTIITRLVGINDHIWVDFSLPLNQSQLALGTSVKVLPNSDHQNAAEGIVIAQDSIVSADSRNLMYRARVPNVDKLPHNTIVNVEVPMANELDALTVPASAIRYDALGSFVYILNEDTANNGYRAQRQSVVLAPSANALSGETHLTSTITKGLQEGQLIAANGSFKLRSQLLVFVKSRPQIQP
jgi:membrane fusion protein, multidrug efflux system